jgi:molybdenum cofactor synthesis domain-containing protein
MKEEFRGRRKMRPFGDLTSYHDALRVALDACTPVAGHERLPLARCGGRCAAWDVTAPADVPASDRAAMDGYAVKAADLSGGGEVTLKSRGRVLAGELGGTELRRGECYEVATGALLPRGADAVVPVEQTRIGDDAVVVVAGVGRGDHVSRRGEDLRRGDVVVAAGQPFTAAAVAALASIGVGEIDARRRPEVLLMPTGDELVALGEELLPGQTYDSNSVGVQLLLESNGAEVTRTPIVRDDPEALANGVRDGAFDLVVTLGGTSVGRHDLVLDVIASIGDVLVHGIAIKPGKPVLLARVGDRPLLGLPGFPTSCVFTAHTFAEPMVRKLGGLPLQHRRTARAVLADGVRSPAGKLQFLTVAMDGDRAVPVYRASSTITSMSRAEGWIEIPEDTEEVHAGAPVEVTFF